MGLKERRRKKRRKLKRLLDKGRRGRYIKKLRKQIKRLTRRIRRRRRRINFSAGAPHWGGCEDILRREVDPICAKRGLRPNSAKRSETYGNPGSDHHTSQINASAHDYPTTNNYALAQEIRNKLSRGRHSDYAAFYFTRGGRRFRGQIIAGTHGTGPHLHVGLRRA